MIGEPLSNIDTAWLRMESPSQPMMITVAMVFGPPFDLERLQVVIRERLLRFRRFRQRIVNTKRSSGRPYWQDDPEFDLGFHLQSTALKAPGDEAAFRDVIGDLIGSQLDFSRPLWQFNLFDEYGEGWALVARVHHCLADGPALLNVLSSLVDNGQAGPTPAAGEGRHGKSGGGSRSIAAFRAAAWATKATSEQGVEVLRNPSHLLSLARLSGSSLSTLTRLLFRPQDPMTAFRGRLGHEKRVAWSEPVELEEVKAMGRLAGGTVNDVMLAATSGALRRYLRGRGEAVDGLTIRAGLSLNLRSPRAEEKLGNQAGALLVPLPIGLAGPLERFYAVKSSMDSLKESNEGTLIYGLLQALGMAPAGAQAALVESYTTRDSAMVSNVPGPRQTVLIAGAPLETLLFWIPAFGNVGLGLNIVSYAGQIRLGVATDQGLVPDPERIVADFHIEIEALQASVAKLEVEGNRASARKSPVEAMNSQLDDALRALDEMLERQQSANRTQASD